MPHRVTTGRKRPGPLWGQKKGREASGCTEAHTYRTCSNLIVAFAIALKHKLRFEPYTAYDDLSHLVSHLQTFSGTATHVDPGCLALPRKNWFKEVGEYLGVSFAESNPRKLLKKARRPLGNLPLEILNYLGRHVDNLCHDGKLPIPMQQTIACKCPS